MLIEDTNTIEPPLVGRLASFVLIEAMELLTEIPQGGIGDAGSTMEEIEAAETDGRCVEGDATYHAVQKAWWKLRSLLP